MAEPRKRADLKNVNVQFIIAGMAGLVDDGFSPHEVFEIVEDVKSQTFHGLSDIHRENKKEG